MHGPTRLAVLLLALSACPAGTADTTTSEPGTSTTSTTTTTTGGSTSLPTTTTQDVPTSTGEPTTDPTSTSSSTTDPTSTGEPPAASCVDAFNESMCEQNDECAWASVFQFIHGAKGCQADVIDFCVTDTTGVASTWYHGEEGDYQVVQFEYTPTDLPPDWKQCDCDGPLACFCGFDAPECPERLQEFCAAATSEAACDGATVNAKFRCGWLQVFPEGDNDDTCTTQSFHESCFAVDMAGETDCEPVTLDYALCQGPIQPAYWREVEGKIEVTKICGPVPPGWTACEEVDTPAQPDECGCLCNEGKPYMP